LIIMLSLTLKSIRANKARFVLTSIAVMLGVAFMAGTMVLTDTIKQSYDNVTTNVYKTTDAVVRSSSHAKDTNDRDVRAKISASTLAAVRSVPGVKAAEAQQLGIAVVVGRNGALLDANENRSVPVAYGWQQTRELNPMELVSGHAPRGPDEIVIDRASANKGHFAVGDAVHVLSQLGSQPYHIAGVATYGGADSAAGAQVVAFSQETASKVFGTPGSYDAIQVVAAPGYSQDKVVTNIRTALHDPKVDVISGTKAADEARKATGTSLQFVNIFLMTFALVALVVGSFVIYNTFSITVAQRTKETALLRAIGARRKQVMRSIRLEALFIGVFASAIGVVAGIATAQVLRLVLQAFSLELPNGGTVVRPATIVVSMITGVTVTLTAAWLPARKASKVAPIEALRDTALDTSSHSKRRVVIGFITAALGGLFMAQGLSGAGVGSVGLGALGIFLGVAMLGPVIARTFARVVGWPLPHVRGVAGTLARENAMRNPRRTSATSSALMIGVALVAFITVFAASAKASVATSVDKAMKSDWIVTTQFGMGGVSPGLTQRIDALPETGTVAAMRSVSPQVDGVAKDAVAFDPAKINGTVGLDVRAGDVTSLGTHEIAVQTDEAKSQHLNVGSTVTLAFPETGPQRLRVVALYKTKEPVGSYVMSMQLFEANVSTHVDDEVLISKAPGYSAQQAHAAIARTIADTPTAKLMTRAEFKGSIANQIDKILNLVYVLLAMALVIALFGIANTLALSVFERTREFGLLRAVGMSRAQVRSTVRWESVLIAMLGTTLGTAIGLGFAWAITQAAKSQGLGQLTIPVRELAVIVALAAVAAVGAAALPARRAARLDMLSAISD
jgi:putative ABC transport system permease protein